MKLEDAKIGTRVMTSNGNIATIIGFWPNPEAIALRLDNGTPSTGMIYNLRLMPYKPEEIVEHTLEAFARSTVNQVIHGTNHF